ncbi:LamG domain-containing protein [Candidatus Poribacteria bacterium]|nr:LamG domain-containing protein [Candidatus Poribacteria bacterium]
MNSRLILFVTCLTLSMFILSFFSFSGELKEKLIAYWSFDTGSGDEATDDSGNGRNGTLVGPKWASGKFGSALEFDGVDDYVDLAKTSANLFDGIAEFTLTAWVKPVHKGANDWPAILQKYQGSVWNDMPWVGYYESKDQWAWEITTDKAENMYRETGVKVSFDVFSYVAFTVDIPDKVSKFYLDGKREDEFKMAISGTKMSSNPDGGSSKISIGAIRYAGGNCWFGAIDELRIWSRVLDADEIKKNMETEGKQLLAIERKGKLTTTWGGIKAQ